MNSTCSQPGCDGISVTRGLCNKHYKSLRRHGLLEDVRQVCQRGLTPAARVESANTTRLGSCIVWMDSRTKDGYGSLTFCGKAWLAHRFSYMARNGPIPDGLVIRHKCDNPPCINPAHLEAGTIAENVHDSITRKRFANGERTAAHKLTDSDVAEIRRLASSGVHNRDIAQRFNCHRTYVSRLVAGRRRVEPTNPNI